MTQWQPITDQPYFSPDGFIVTALSSEKELVAMGDALRNGVGGTSNFAQHMRSKYAAMGRAGKFQVVQVNAPTGQLVATTRLYIRNPDTDPQVGVRFVRGFNNVPAAGDSLEAQAIEGFLASGISPHFPVAVSPQAAAPASPVNAYTAAKEACQKYNEGRPDNQHITYIQALSMGMGKVAPKPVDAVSEAASKAATDETWAVPVVRQDYADGISLRPVESVSALESLGEELENQFLKSHKVNVGVRCIRDGNYLIAAVLVNGAVEAMAEYTVQNGQVVLQSVTGYVQVDVKTGPIARAAVNFAKGLNVGLDGQTLFAVGNGFSTDPDADFELSDVVKAPMPAHEAMYAGPLAAGPLAAVNGGYDAADNGDYVDNGEEDEDEAELEAEWVPLLMDEGDIKTANGCSIRIATNRDGLAVIGSTMKNPLVNQAVIESYATFAEQGKVQHYSVHDENGVMIGCGCLVVSDGEVQAHGTVSGLPVYPLGPNNSHAPMKVNLAVSEFVSRVNDGEIELNVQVSGSLFVQPEVKHGYGY